MTGTVAGTLYEAARWLKVPALLRRLTGGAVVMCYHNVVSGPTSGDPSIHMSVDRFERQIGWLRHHFDFVGLDELRARLHDGRSVRGLATLTFDDGYVGFFRHALPVLRSAGLPSAVFLVAEAAQAPRAYWWDVPLLVDRATPERRDHWLHSSQGDAAAILALEGAAAPTAVHEDLLPASWDQVKRSLGPDLTIGAHTMRHRCLTALDDAELRWELDACIPAIREALGVTPWAIAYPYGAWDRRIRDAARASGYALGLTLELRRVGRGSDDPAALPRINIPAGISDAAFEAWVSGLHRSVQ